MSLKINHNTAAINSWRNLKQTDEAMSKSLERLSSGERLNRAADGPASLVVAEQMRAQVASLKQATSNSEIAVSLTQTAESGLNEVNNILIRMRQLALHASNEGANDDKMLAADQAEIDNLVQTLDGISRQSQFGTRMLLDGSNGVSGVGVGEGVRFVSATTDTESSPADGFEIDITEAATKARLEGSRGFSEDEINAGNMQIVLHEGGRSLTYYTKVGETMEAIVRNLNTQAQQNNMDVSLGVTEDGRMWVEHNQYGSEPSFGAVCSAAGILSEEANQLTEAIQGTDVQGTIGGEMAYGDGQYLTGGIGTKAEGLVVQYNGGVRVEVATDEQGNPILDENGQPAEVKESKEGAVYVTNNALNFQVGPAQMQTARLALPNINAYSLGQRVENDSGYRNLADIDLTTFQGAQDALLLIDQSIDEVTTTRGSLGAFQKNTLETNLNNLRYATENMMSAESELRDTDMAAEMSEFTKQQILLSSGTAMLGQANQVPKSVLSLLNAQ